jgi:hypothetical protein
MVFDGLSTIEMLVAILNKPSRYRTERELAKLLPIVKTIKFFQEFLAEAMAATDDHQYQRMKTSVVN